ncbi:MAG TPA: inositol monophosphatase family protein, partial [Gemmatimonadales bacterium]|nr:inositol monophosphatase family protein [Gemmatimonadales bacterium]
MTALRSDVMALARHAGDATMTYYDRTDVAGLREKEDRSPVTLADEVAHDILVQGLRRIDPDTPVVSEEAEAAVFEIRRGWRRFWLVDPLDGTKEFIKRRAEFTVNVALIEDGEPVFGVVLAPALDLLYWAAKGEGAWKEEKGGPAERIYSSEPTPGEPLTVVESLSHPSAELEQYLKTIPVARR